MLKNQTAARSQAERTLLVGLNLGYYRSVKPLPGTPSLFCEESIEAKYVTRRCAYEVGWLARSQTAVAESMETKRT